MDNFKDNETDIQHLIISSLEGTASEEELLVLQKWLEESEHLTSSLRTPKFFVKEFSYFLMPCHQHGLRINLLVQR